MERNEIELLTGNLPAYKRGDYVEKFEGDARWFGWIVEVYLTRKNKLRYVVEIDPQGFQMIVNEKQIRWAD